MLEPTATQPATRRRSPSSIDPAETRAILVRRWVDGAPIKTLCREFGYMRRHLMDILHGKARASVTRPILDELTSLGLLTEEDRTWSQRARQDRLASARARRLRALASACEAVLAKPDSAAARVVLEREVARTRLLAGRDSEATP